MGGDRDALWRLQRFRDVACRLFPTMLLLPITLLTAQLVLLDSSPTKHVSINIYIYTHTVHAVDNLSRHKTEH